MKLSPREILRATKPGDPHSTLDGEVNVLIVLKQAQLDEKTKDRLIKLGLHYRRAIARNKFVGSIPSELLKRLRSDPAVAEVEISVVLHPHLSR